MRVFYLLALTLLITVIQIILFQVNVVSFIAGTKETVQPKFRLPAALIAKEKLNIVGNVEPSNDKEKDVLARKRKISEIRAQREAKRYEEAYRKGMNKTAAVSHKWITDRDKYDCYLQSSLQCDTLAFSNKSAVPSHFQGACAPSFIIAGTVKSGTTSLYFYLMEHPQIHRALSGQFDKEVRFFTEHWTKGPEWYIQQFPPVRQGDFADEKIHMMNGEASPTYFYDPSAPQRIKNTLPNVKLIVILRDPVERTYSDKMQLIANRIQFRSDVYEDMKYQIDVFTSCFHSAMKMAEINSTMQAFFHCYNDKKLAHRLIKSHPYVMDSIYIFQVRNWLRFFPREQILFIKGEDLYSNAALIMEQIGNFLGLCPFDWTPYVKQVHNRRERGYPRMPPEVEALLVDFYFSFTHDLYSELDMDFKWKSTETTPGHNIASTINRSVA